MINSSQLATIMLANTIGLSVLTEVLKAAYSFVNSPQHRGHFTTFQECSESFAIVQGSSLDILLKTYDLDYNAEDIRSNFNYLIKRNGNGKHYFLS